MTTPLQAELVGDTQIRFTRHFAAPPARVFAAHFDPGLIRRWMTGPAGWHMPVCEIAPEVGAPVRFAWENAEGRRFGLEGVVTEIDAPHRCVHTERFDFPGATGTTVETSFHADGDGTRLELVVTYASSDARQQALESGMTDGMEESYARIDPMLADAA